MLAWFSSLNLAWNQKEKKTHRIFCDTVSIYWKIHLKVLMYCTIQYVFHSNYVTRVAVQSEEKIDFQIILFLFVRNIFAAVPLVVCPSFRVLYCQYHPRISNFPDEFVHCNIHSSEIIFIKATFLLHFYISFLAQTGAWEVLIFIHFMVALEPTQK